MKFLALDRLQALLRAKGKLTDLAQKTQAGWVASSASANRLEVLLGENLSEARRWLNDMHDLTRKQQDLRTRLEAIAVRTEQKHQNGTD